LLDELKELNDKIKNEELLNKLDRFKQNSKNQIKNLAQLVELTKKYYVEKSGAIAENFRISKRISDSEKDNSVEKQRILHPISTNSRRS
jgi:ferritin-like metal-binding protein YciE